MGTAVFSTSILLSHKQDIVCGAATMRPANANVYYALVSVSMSRIELLSA
jgi:hypothetical protein